MFDPTEQGEKKFNQSLLVRSITIQSNILWQLQNFQAYSYFYFKFENNTFEKVEKGKRRFQGSLLISFNRSKRQCFHSGLRRVGTLSHFMSICTFTMRSVVSTLPPLSASFTPTQTPDTDTFKHTYTERHLSNKIKLDCFVLFNFHGSVLNNTSSINCIANIAN